MIPKHYIELMNREIDGCNSADESADLRRFLDSDTEGRTYFDDLRGVAATFAAAGSVPAPEGIDERILSSIAECEALRSQRINRGSLAELLSPRRKLAYAFAAGLAVGLILLAVLYRSLADTTSLNLDDLYGTFAARSNAGKLLSSDSFDIRTAACTGSVTVRYLERALVAEISVESNRQVDVILASSEAIVFEGMRTRGAPVNGMTAHGGSVAFSCEGRCSYLLDFADERGAHPPVAVKIVSEGTIIAEKMIQSGRK